MKHIINIAILACLLSIIAGCHQADGNSVDKHRSRDDSVLMTLPEFQMRTIHQAGLPISSSDSLTLNVAHDRDGNLYLLLYHKTLLMDAGALEGGNLAATNAISTVKLNDDTLKEFVVRTYVEGSTYGYSKIFVIWYNIHDESWHITKDNFTRAMLEDVNRDGIVEFVETYRDLATTDTVFTFNQGAFLPMVMSSSR